MEYAPTIISNEILFLTFIIFKLYIYDKNSEIIPTPAIVIAYFMTSSTFFMSISISTNIPFIYGNKVDNITDMNCITKIVTRRYLLIFKLSFNNLYNVLSPH